MNQLIMKNRLEAGTLLAEKLGHLKGLDGIVLAIPRGGVPVGYPIARSLKWDLDVVLTKKIGYPGNPEFAIGSVSTEAVDVSPEFVLPQGYIEKETERIRAELRQRYHRYNGDRKPPHIQGKSIIITDDGIATGHTILAAIALLRLQQPEKIIVASPVVPFSKVKQIQAACDEFCFLASPVSFIGVGLFYEDFTQVSDEEVISLLNEMHAASA